MLRKFAKSVNVSKSAKPKMREARSEGFKNTDACNNSIKTKSKASDFIFFGCWNNINCKKEYVYRDIVLDYISLNEDAIKQLYIAGDNWYTNERKIGEVNYKVYLTDVLTTGYAKLYAMKKEVYIAVGNHDEDNDGDNGHTLLKKDCNINTQKYYLRQINEGKLREETMSMPPTLNDLHLLALSNQFADNSMCEKGIYIYVDDIGVRYNNGNIVIIINTNRFDDYTTGLKYLGSIKAVIKRVENAKTTEQIFVMGHIPLFDFKPDKSAKSGNADQIKLHKINKKDERYDRMILKLFDLFAVHNIVYICADTHNFSIMRIQSDNKVVIQITAGTGGADPDLLQTEYAKQPYYVDVNDGIFNIQAYALNPYGYVKIKMEENKRIKVCYTQIIKDEKDKTIQSVLPKTNVFTYRVNMYSKTIDNTPTTTATAKATATATAKSISDMEVYKANKQKVCSHPTAGYITNLKSDVVCYKKNKNK
jgi:hypothetical protein